ncbi:MAG: hypothetical protein AAGA93_12290 [Actinomycetota bacterium]
MDQPRHRFSGPELSDLLDEVVSEHGETAAIAAVNRVRSGGVAGFFCREEFEVVVADGEAGRETDGAADGGVDPGGVDRQRPAGPVGPNAAGVGRQHDADDELIADLFADRDDEDEPIARTVPSDGGDPNDPTVWPSTVASGPGRSLDDPPVADGDRQPARLAYRFDEDQADESVFGGPVAPGADRDRFLALLERRLDETSATEADLSFRRLRTSGQTAGTPTAEPDRQPVAPAPALTPPSAPTAPADPTQRTIASSSRSNPSTGSSPGAVGRPTTAVSALPPFWSGLDATAAELESFVPDGAPVVAVVGPLPLATTVVRRLLDGPDLGSAEVFVLTDRAGIVSEPSWRLVRTANRLVHLVDRRLSGPGSDGEHPNRTATTTDDTGAAAGAGARGDGPERELVPTVLVLDAPTELPSWLVALQHRLRSVGVGLFRYVVAGQPTGADLERFRQGTDVPAVIDLLSRVEPARVVELIEQRHPIVSVAGVDLGPELLRAFRGHVESERTAAGRDGSSGG